MKYKSFTENKTSLRFVFAFYLFFHIFTAHFSFVTQNSFNFFNGRENELCSGVVLGTKNQNHNKYSNRKNGKTGHYCC